MACWSSAAVAAPERLLAASVEIATVSASKAKCFIVGELVDILISAGSQYSISISALV